MTNAPALRTVLEHITAHQDEWRQDEWTACFAGQTLRVLAGATTTGDCPCCGGLSLDDGSLWGSNIGVKAAELLGLTPEKAYRLFYAGNSLERLTELVEEFTAEESAALDVELVA